MAKDTSEEQAKKEAEQKAYADRLSTLKSLMVYAGAKELNGESNKFGEIGAKAGKLGYASFITSPEADKYRKAIYTGKMEEYNQLETVAMPEYATNYELEKMAIGLIHDASSRVKFSDLEKIVTEANKECKFKVPEKFKGLTAEQVQVKMQKEIEGAKAKGEKYNPSEEENDAMITYQTLMEAYNLGAAFKMVQGYYMNSINQTSEDLNEKYKPKEEKKKE